MALTKALLVLTRRVRLDERPEGRICPVREKWSRRRRLFSSRMRRAGSSALARLLASTSTEGMERARLKKEAMREASLFPSLSKRLFSLEGSRRALSRAPSMRRKETGLIFSSKAFIRAESIGEE